MPEITQQNLSSANHEAHLAQVTSNLELQQKLLRKLAKMNNKQSPTKSGAVINDTTPALCSLVGLKRQPA